MSRWDVIEGDARVVLRRDFFGASVDSVVCDPPYELGFMGKRWDASGSTGVAAVAEGFRFAGVELSPEYVEIARARIGAEARVKR